jgi:uncharacterized protein with HEPN domain
LILEQDRLYLEYILESAALIREYTLTGEKAFMESALLQDAVLRRLQTLAESTQRLSEEVKVRIVDVDWRAISGFRNVLVHDYMNGIDLKRVWDVVKNALPELEMSIRGFMQINRAD